MHPRFGAYSRISEARQMSKMNISSVAVGGGDGETAWAGNINSAGPELGGGVAPSAGSLTSRLFEPDKANYARDLLAIVAFALRLDTPHVNFNGEEGVLITAYSALAHTA